MTPHAPSCALHNATASEPGPCDCGATDILERINEAAKVAPRETEALLAECAITIKAYRSQLKFAIAAHDGQVQDKDTIAGQFVKANAALLKYGHHIGSCEKVGMGPLGECTCGFDQARGKE